MELYKVLVFITLALGSDGHNMLNHFNDKNDLAFFTIFKGIL